MAANFITRTVAASAFAVAALTTASSAFALIVAVEPITPSPLGPTPSLMPSKIPGIGPFTHYRQFDVVAPYTVISATYSYTSPSYSPMTYFTGEVVSLSGCVTITATHLDCTLGSDVGTFTAFTATELTLSGLNLAAGSYAYRFSGGSQNVTTELSGQTWASASSDVPAPAVLGLLAIGMLGTGITSRSPRTPKMRTTGEPRRSTS